MMESKNKNIQLAAFKVEVSSFEFFKNAQKLWIVSFISGLHKNKLLSNNHY